MSTIPAALNALVALAEQVPDVQVLDGAPTTQTRADVIVIGYSGTPSEPDVRSTLTREQLDMEPDLERYDVMCMASAWRGQAHRDNRPDARTVRDRAFELLAAFRAALAEDSRLGDLVMMARMSTLDVIADQTEGGPVCTIRFQVHVDAYTAAV